MSKRSKEQRISPKRFMVDVPVAIPYDYEAQLYEDYPWLDDDFEDDDEDDQAESR